MNDCELTSRTGAYYDGEMTPAEGAAFARHVELCPQCASELQNLRGLSAALSQAEAATPSAAAMAKFHRAVDALPSRGLLRIAEAFSAVAAAILIACGVGLTMDANSSATAGIPAWETKVASAEQASEGSEELLAKWITQDLSWKGEHE